jgi:hypothetical protein
MMTTLSPTLSNPSKEEWAINDSVIRLRTWGKDLAYPLHADQSSSLIGTDVHCAIQIQDPTHLTSREHAQLQRVQGQWVALNHNSKNGLYRDGARQEKFVLTPGMEIGLGGGATLIAESDRLMALRSVLARMLGWGVASADRVDLALRAIRLAAQRRANLVLVGEDVVPLAEELHRLTLGTARPFVFCNPRRRTSELPWNPMQCASSGRAALERAACGTICISMRCPPSDLQAMMRELQQPGCQTQLIVCTDRTYEAERFHAAPIVIPSLVTRKHEIERIIREYATDAAGPLELGEHWLTPAERAWIRANLRTLAGIQKVTLRLAAIKQAGSISAGARRLGISHVAMAKWIQNQDFPADLAEELTKVTWARRSGGRSRCPAS